MGSSKKHKRDKDVSSSKKHKHKDRVRVPSPPEFRVENHPDGRAGGGDRDSREIRDVRGEGRDRERDRERRHHKKHKERRPAKNRSSSPNNLDKSRTNRERDEEYHSDSSDVIEVPIAPPAPKISDPPAVPQISAASTSSRHSTQKLKSPSPKKVDQRRSPSPIPENGAGDCLSIADTNKLRAKLGLKPLEIGNSSTSQQKSSSQSGGDATKNKSGDDGPAQHPTYKDEWGEFQHKPADNIASRIEAEKLREKFRQKKEKRLLEDKLKKVKTLGESDDFDDINAWLDKSREKERLKAEADKRAKALEEMDDEFGVNDLVKQDIREIKRKSYTDCHLRGLKVDHEMDSFGEGKTVILTLKDHDVLDENDDTLVNVNMAEDERYKKNVENKKKNPQHYGYDVYEEQFDHFGNPIERNILSKYDDELNDGGFGGGGVGGGGGRKKQFTIGEDIDEERDRKRKLLEIKTKLAGKRLESLDGPLIHLASDTYTEDEMAKFKKPKRKVKKIRQKLRADDLQPLLGDIQDNSLHLRKRSRRHSNDDNADGPDYSDLKIEEEDDDLEQILSKARRLKQKESLISKALTSIDIELKQEIKNEQQDDEMNGGGVRSNNSNDSNELATKDNHIILNSTAEFCRTLGDIPTYGMSGNRDEDAGDMMNFVEEHMDQVEPYEEERSTGTWNSVNPDMEIITNDKSNEMTEVAILDEEPDVGSSMGAALKLALSKGYLEKEEMNRPSNTRMAHLQAKNYSIEDKTYGEDEKFQRRDRYQHGPISDFKEKDTYRPNVKLEYIDDNGRLLNEKEAFRYLSHKFHGKGPGKNKIEKRLKKNEQDGLMMKMSSTDTPLGTLTMLQHKQKETHSPYIVLSGSKQIHTTTSIIKHK